MKKAKLNIEKKIIAPLLQELDNLGFAKLDEITLTGGVKGFRYAQDNAGGDRVYCTIGAAFSTNRNLFARIAVGLSAQGLGKILLALDDSPKQPLVTTVPQLEWYLGGGQPYGSHSFESPSYYNPACEIDLDPENIDAHVELTRGQLPHWIDNVRSYLSVRPIYSFYQYERRNNMEFPRQAIQAVLKILCGEESIGFQLLNDFLNTATGKNPLMSDYDGIAHKIYGFISDPEMAEFYRTLLRNARRLVKEGVFKAERDRIDSMIRIGC